MFESYVINRWGGEYISDYFIVARNSPSVRFFL